MTDLLFPCSIIIIIIISEVQHDRSAATQPAGGAGVGPRSRPFPEWRPGLHVDAGEDQTTAAVRHQALPVLPQHQELQLLHLPDCVRPSPSSFVSPWPSHHHNISSWSSLLCRVQELSHHFSEMDPVRQKWIYTFFMYPFLSGHGVAGRALILLILVS